MYRTSIAQPGVCHVWRFVRRINLLCSCMCARVTNMRFQSLKAKSNRRRENQEKKKRKFHSQNNWLTSFVFPKVIRRISKSNSLLADELAIFLFLLFLPLTYTNNTNTHKKEVSENKALRVWSNTIYFLYMNVCLYVRSSFLFGFHVLTSGLVDQMYIVGHCVISGFLSILLHTWEKEGEKSI